MCKLHEFGSFRTFKIKSVVRQFVIERSLLERHLQCVVLDGPLNHDDLGKTQIPFAVIVRILNVRFDPAIRGKDLLAGDLEIIIPVDP